MDFLLIPIAIVVPSVLVYITYKLTRSPETELQVKYLKERTIEDLEHLINDGIKSQWRPKGTTFYADGFYIVMIAKEI